MTSGAESFVIALGRAAGQSRWRKLLKHLQPADRDDVTAMAILWCWKNRSTYSPSMSLADWFFNAARHALRDWHNDEDKIKADTLNAEIPIPDETFERAAMVSAAQELARRVTPNEQKIAILQAKGFTRGEIAEQLGISKYEVDGARQHLRQLKRLLPEGTGVAAILRLAPAPNSETIEPHRLQGIDKVLDKLDRPKSGGQAVFADDYKMHERKRVSAEDIRGQHAIVGRYAGTISDYEGNAPQRRICLDSVVWVAEQFKLSEDRIPCPIQFPKSN